MGYAALSDGFNGLSDAQQVREALDKELLASWRDRETFGMDVEAFGAIPPAAPKLDQNGTSPGRRNRA